MTIFYSPPNKLALKLIMPELPSVKKFGSRRHRQVPRTQKNIFPANQMPKPQNMQSHSIQAFSRPLINYLWIMWVSLLIPVLSRCWSEITLGGLERRRSGSTEVNQSEKCWHGQTNPGAICVLYASCMGSRKSPLKNRKKPHGNEWTNEQWGVCGEIWINNPSPAQFNDQLYM